MATSPHRGWTPGADGSHRSHLHTPGACGTEPEAADSRTACAGARSRAEGLVGSRRASGGEPGTRVVYLPVHPRGKCVRLWVHGGH